MKYRTMTGAAAVVALSLPLSIGSAHAQLAPILSGGAAAQYRCELGMSRSDAQWQGKSNDGRGTGHSAIFHVSIFPLRAARRDCRAASLSNRMSSGAAIGCLWEFR